MKITKDMLYTLLREPTTHIVFSMIRPHISIDYCIESNIERKLNRLIIYVLR